MKVKDVVNRARTTLVDITKPFQFSDSFFEDAMWQAMQDLYIFDATLFYNGSEIVPPTQTLLTDELPISIDMRYYTVLVSYLLYLAYETRGEIDKSSYYLQKYNDVFNQPKPDKVVY